MAKQKDGKVCKNCGQPPGPVSDHRLELGYCFPCYLVKVERRDQ
ncbi:hypothetical protein LCGC14_0853240 [marine sediment metagenome]|uniref:Uncharacterized protein n=1 Tax=marine sediment metagenome TaxID=412755 RepID=A0A0F9PUX8_9ZZZZ